MNELGSYIRVESNDSSWSTFVGCQGVACRSLMIGSPRCSRGWTNGNRLTCTWEELRRRPVHGRRTRERRRGLRRPVAVFVLHTASEVVHYLTQLITLPRPCLCLLKLGHWGSGTYPRQVSRAVHLHYVANAKLHQFSKGTVTNT